MRRRPSLLWMLLLTSVVSGGCQKALFPPNTPRTQFEKYDRMRNVYTPTQETDVFGNPKPALRARLSQDR